MLTYTPNKYKGGVMLPILKEKNVTENSLAVPYVKCGVDMGADNPRQYCGKNMCLGLGFE